MSGMVNGWQLPTSTITGTTDTEIILAIGFAVIAFGLGFMAGNQR